MNLNGIADPSAESVLDLLVRAEAGVNEAAEMTAEARGVRVSAELDSLAGVLRNENWEQHTTGVHFVRLLADLVEARGDGLHEFVMQTIDAKRNAFRPYRVSQYVRARYGVGITNHTVQRMLGILADAGRRRQRSAGLSEAAGSKGAREDVGRRETAGQPTKHRRRRVTGDSSEGKLDPDSMMRLATLTMSYARRSNRPVVTSATVGVGRRRIRVVSRRAKR